MRTIKLNKKRQAVHLRVTDEKKEIWNIQIYEDHLSIYNQTVEPIEVNFYDNNRKDDFDKKHCHIWKGIID